MTIDTFAIRRLTNHWTGRRTTSFAKTTVSEAPVNSEALTPPTLESAPFQLEEQPLLLVGIGAIND